MKKITTALSGALAGIALAAGIATAPAIAHDGEHLNGWTLEAAQREARQYQSNCMNTPQLREMREIASRPIYDASDSERVEILRNQNKYNEWVRRCTADANDIAKYECYAAHPKGSGKNICQWVIPYEGFVYAY